MKIALIAIPLLILAMLLYIYQGDKVNKDIQVNHQELRVQSAQFDADFDRRWGDKSAQEMSEQRAIIESEKVKLNALYNEQKRANEKRNNAVNQIESRLNNELEENKKARSIDDFYK